MDLTLDAAAKVASQAVAMAKLSAQVIRAAGSDELVELADEPVHAEKTWVSSYEIDPFTVPDEEKAGLLADGAGGSSRRTASTTWTPRCSPCTRRVLRGHRRDRDQQRVRLHPALTAVSVDDSSGEFDSMRTLAPPVGRGWET
ncbi:TldD/PmbA family protein OS=Streptomyces tendae OX=1932 GN=F3L20_08750 PE=3 SV=1 [Streptomyces tendae]